jgi:hypothetical protein
MSCVRRGTMNLGPVARLDCRVFRFGGKTRQTDRFGHADFSGCRRPGTKFHVGSPLGDPTPIFPKNEKVSHDSPPSTSKLNPFHSIIQPTLFAAGRARSLSSAAS